MKYNRRKIKNMLDRYSIYSYLKSFSDISNIILTTKQLNVLGIILFQGHKNKLCIADLRNYLKPQRHSSLSRIVGTLKVKGLVNKEKNNGRGKGNFVSISLSDKGKKYLVRLYTLFNRISSDKNFNTPIEEDIIHILDKGYKEKKVA
jgi:DNA-binding MarR family transcriptional regulator